MSDRLDQRHAVITGGSGALGRVVVDALLAAGAEVHVPCVESEVPASLRERATERLHATPAVDLADEAAVTDYYAALPSLWASVHIAGGFAMAPVLDTTLDAFVGQFRLNAVTAFLSCREAARAIKRSGQGGRIVNVAARPALAPVGGMVAYSVAKSAVAALTRSLAVELVGDDILVNAIVPSVIDTPANRAGMPDADHAAWPTPAQLAATIGFLVSPANAVTSGALVPVYGRA